MPGMHMLGIHIPGMQKQGGEHMSVRQSLLAILDQGPCYGYQLRAEFERRTGSTWPLNVGQIYNTLDRLERDGLVVKGATDDHGHVYYEITDAGTAEARRWLTSPVDRPSGTRDELAIKLALAATLPGADAGGILSAQRRAGTERLARLRASAPTDPEGPEALARAIVIDGLVLAAESELRWLDRTAERLSRHPDGRSGLELSAARPRRGRPAGARGALAPPSPVALP
jgi:DNA-binding PadR family transcriptional regulator